MNPNPEFSDRPGTRIRIELPMAEPPPPRPVAKFFNGLFKLAYAVAAGVFCVALLSYMPTQGRSLAPFVPADCALLVRVPSGAALHRAFAESESFNQLLDDPDTGNFAGATWHLKGSESGSLRERFAAQAALIRKNVSSFAPQRVSDLFAFIGGESALCYSPADAAGKERALLLTRVSGSDGFLSRLAAPFLNLKNVSIFDLGGGLIAVGWNGARPEFGEHALPSIVSTEFTTGSEPLLRVACETRALAVTLSDEDKTREKLNHEIDAGDSILSRLSEEGVPDPILYALLKPPTIAQMLNLSALPERVSIDVFARKPEEGAGLEAVGVLDGALPELPNPAAGRIEQMQPQPRFSDFPAPGMAADLTLPIDLRALFIWHVAGEMKLKKDAQIYSRGQRHWVQRFKVLEADGVEIDKNLWPAVGRVIHLTLHEANKAAAITALGSAKAWLEFKPEPERVDDAFFAAFDLARVRWDLFEDDQKATVKPPYVRHFRELGSKDFEDRYAMATSIMIVPAWSAGAKGLRITSDAGSLALRDGPANEKFPNRPERFDAYRIKFDGARLAASAEGLATMLYDDIEDEMGNAQKFHAAHPESAQNIRLARKWAALAGELELTLTPAGRGAALRLNWRGGHLQPTSAELAGRSNQDSVPPPPAPNADPKKNAEDDAPPPPPPGN